MRMTVLRSVPEPELHKLQPRGYLAKWEAQHPFDREARVDPLLAFRLRERRKITERLFETE